MEELIENRSNYKNLITYRKANTIFCMTYYFCEKYLTKGDRTVDRMIQAARSGKQNIIEGCAVSATSAKTEIKLINVAKASLREPLEDFEDYLKTRNHRQREKGSIEFEAMKRLASEHNDSDYFMSLVQSRPPETIANMAIILLNQTDYLLFRQLKALEKRFLETGGFTEKLYRLRTQNRERNK